MLKPNENFENIKVIKYVYIEKTIRKTRQKFRKYFLKLEQISKIRAKLKTFNKL